ncbi:MAG TPA: hypothetical protein VI997_11275, partial [Candidatus Thermoplasmatota archaeon]|nr:hypothetical protein [Candidatus Thermoplasmatota archaeon]
VGRAGGTNSPDVGPLRLTVQPVPQNDGAPYGSTFDRIPRLVGHPLELAGSSRGASAENGFAPWSPRTATVVGLDEITVETPSAPAVSALFGPGVSVGAGAYSCGERAGDGVRWIPQSATVWYNWTAPGRPIEKPVPDGEVQWARDMLAGRARLVTANTFGSPLDTMLSVWEVRAVDDVDGMGKTNGVHEGTYRVQVECNDDYLGAQSRVRFAALDGERYLFMIGSKDPAGGDFVLNLPAANDDRDSATVVVGAASDRVSAVGATVGPDEPVQDDCTLGRTLWWRWVARSGGPASATAAATGKPTSLAVYLANARTPVVACVQGAAPVRADWIAEAGATYFFQIGTDDPVEVSVGIAQTAAAGAALLLALAISGPFLSTTTARRRRRARRPARRRCPARGRS